MSCSLLIGPDDWSKNQYIQKMKEKVLNTPNDLINYYEAKDKAVSIEQLQDVINTLPFFSDYKLVYLKDTGYFKSGKKDESEKFRQLLTQLPDYLILLIDEKEVDKKLKLYKELKANHTILEFQYMEEDKIVKLLKEKSKEDGVLIDQAVLHYFVQHMSEDMYVILGEWQKLVHYADKQPITKALIDQICVFPLETRVFELIKKIISHQNDSALKMYHDMVQSKESPFGILALVARQFRTMYQIKYLMLQGYDAKQIASQVKMPYFAVRDIMSQVSHYSFKQIETLIHHALETDKSIKTGKIEMIQGVELFIIEALTIHQ